LKEKKKNGMIDGQLEVRNKVIICHNGAEKIFF
jgi:hypothetical protein